MRKQFLPFAGVLVGVLVDLLIHYIAAATEHLPFIQQLFSPLGIILMAILVLVGLAVGVVIEKSHQSTPSLPASGNLKDNSVMQTITASRGGKASKSPQSVKRHVDSGEIMQKIKATKKGEVTDSGQSIDIT